MVCAPGNSVRCSGLVLQKSAMISICPEKGHIEIIDELPWCNNEKNRKTRQSNSRIAKISQCTCSQEPKSTAWLARPM